MWHQVALDNIGGDGSEDDDDGNHVDDDESESTEVPTPQGGIGPRTCTQFIGGDPVTSRRDGKWDAG